MRGAGAIIAACALAGCTPAQSPTDEDEDEAAPRVELTIEPGCGSIRVTSTPPGVDCVDDCTAEVLVGRVTLVEHIDGPQYCAGDIHCDDDALDPEVEQTWGTSIILRLAPGTTARCLAQSYLNGPEGEGEGEVGEGEIFVADYVDGQWTSVVVPNVDVQGSGRWPPATAADLDDDGLAEVLFADPRGVHLVRDLMSAAPSQELVLATDMWTDDIRELDLEDLDGDGAKDLLVVASESAGLRLLRGLGGGAFAPPVDLLTAPPGLPGLSCSLVNGVAHCFYDMHQAWLADLDGDGDLDIVAAGTDVNVLRNEGSLSFAHVAAVGALPIGDVTYGMVGAAAWRDGDVARIVAAGSWTNSQSGAPSREGAVFALASTDLVTWTVTDGVPFNTFDAELHISRTIAGLSGDAIVCGRGTRLADVDASGALTLGPTLGYCPRLFDDFEGDGDLDMLTRDSNQGVMLGDGDGSWTAAPAQSGVMLDWASTWGDLDGDGVLELVLIL